MNAKQACPWLALLWLAGCATTGPVEPPSQTESTETTEATTVQTHKIDKTDTTACTTAVPVVDETKVLTLSRVLERIDRVAAFEQNVVNQSVARLTADPAGLPPADRYELALLLARKGTDEKTANRAASLLKSLEENTANRAVRKILQLQQRILLLEKQYQTEWRKTAQLQQKIERLKGLEQDLEKSRPMQESLPPQPESTQ
jgi:hypothetical protein